MLGAFELFLSDGVMVHYHNMDFNRVLRAQGGKLMEMKRVYSQELVSIATSVVPFVCVCVLIQ